MKLVDLAVLTTCGTIYLLCILTYNNSFLKEQIAMATSFGFVSWFITIIFHKEIATEVQQVKITLKKYLSK